MTKVYYNENNHLVIENANVGRGAFRNFAGKKTQFNKTGKRTCVILLDEENGEKVFNDGWYVRWRDPRDEQDSRVAMLTVEARFDNYPPKVILISSGGRTQLDEDNIDILDSAEIKVCDLILSPYTWVDKDTGKQWLKGFVRTMYVTLQEDDFGGKYAD